jgi:hypothetical protein
VAGTLLLRALFPGTLLPRAPSPPEGKNRSEGHPHLVAELHLKPSLPVKKVHSVRNFQVEGMLLLKAPSSSEEEGASEGHPHPVANLHPKSLLSAVRMHPGRVPLLAADLHLKLSLSASAPSLRVPLLAVQPRSRLPLTGQFSECVFLSPVGEVRAKAFALLR